MGSKDYLRVVREMRLENGLVWPVPITLAISNALAARVTAGAEVALRARDGRLVAVLEVADKWAPDLALEAREVYGTTDPTHPGVAYLNSAGPVYLGGQIHVLERPAAPRFPRHHRDPRETRALFAERGWSRVVAFQARSPMHRGHEHVTKSALEICDGLLVHPLLGVSRPDDVSADLRMRCYEALLAGYYPAERTLLSVYPAILRYAGPREALLHAITRKNYGCSHFMVGSDPEERQLFDELAPGELGVQPLFFERAFYSTVAASMATEKTAAGDVSMRVEVSSADVRARLARGETPPPEVMRLEVARILVAATRGRSRSAG